MRILALSDWRSNPLEDLEQIILKTQPDLIAYCGDDINRFREMHPPSTDVGESNNPSKAVIDIPKLLRGISWAALEKIADKKRDVNRLRKLLKIFVRANDEDLKNWVDLVFSLCKRTKAPNQIPPKPLLRLIERTTPMIRKAVKKLPKKGDNYVRGFVLGLISFLKDMKKVYFKTRAIGKAIPALVERVFQMPIGIHDIIHHGESYQTSTEVNLRTPSLNSTFPEHTPLRSWEEIPVAPVKLRVVNSLTRGFLIDPQQPLIPPWKRRYLTSNIVNLIEDEQPSHHIQEPSLEIWLSIEKMEGKGGKFFKRWLKLLPQGFHYVPGNDDPDTFVSPMAHDLDESNFEWDDWVIIGIGRSPGNIGYENYSDAELYPRLKGRITQAGNRKIILVSHAPPLGCLDLSRRYGMVDINSGEMQKATHIGSAAIRNVVEEFPNIRLVLCGHSHYWGGMQCTLNQARIINVANDDYPPPLTSRYALVDVSQDDASVTLAEYGINWREVYRLGSKRQHLPRDALPSITDINKINELDEPKLKKRLSQYVVFLKRGKSSIRDLIKVQDWDILDTIPSNAIYIDIETETFTGEPPLFLAAISLVHGDTGQEKFFHVKDYKNSRQMVRALEKYLQDHTGKSLYAWSGYDGRVLDDYGFKHPVINIIPIIRKAAILPGHRLKNVLKYLGLPSSQIPLDDGKYWGILIEHLLKEKAPCPYCTPLLRDLKAYNMHDARAIKLIVSELKRLKRDGRHN